MFNFEKAKEFIEEEYKYWQLEKLEIEKNINLNDSKINSISTDISSIEDKMDKSDYSFHSVNYEDEYAIRLEELKNTQDEMLSENKSLKAKLELIEKRLAKLTSIISDDDNTINNRDINTNKSLLKGIEIERERISRDIHDTVVQSLSALTFKNEFIIKLIEQDKERAKLELNANRNVIKDCINELRNIISDLRPMAIDDLGFRNAFNAVCSKINQNSDKIIKYSFKGNDTVESIVAISCLRIISELTSNSIKHGHCKKIFIELIVNDKLIIIKHRDDGIGFDYENQKAVRYNNTGFGMVMLRERVEALGGVISYSNIAGSDFTIKIPIN